MKPRFSNKRNQALTLLEVVVVVAVLAVLVAIILPGLAAAKRKPQKINCINNLKEIGLAYKIWAGDNNGKHPMFVLVTNGGAMELVATGNVAACFQVMSNELSTPRLLLCPEDKAKIAAPNFTTDFNNDKISYFVGLDTDKTNQQILLSGDDNFAVDGVPVKSGLVQFSRNSNVTWASRRHISYKEHFWTPTHSMGNIGLADGSAWPTEDKFLVQKLQATGVATNRLAIP